MPRLKQVPLAEAIKGTDKPFVGTGGTAMLVITQLHPISLVFTLPEDQLQEVAQQMRKGSLEVDAYSRDDAQKLCAALQKAGGACLVVRNR